MANKIDDKLIARFVRMFKCDTARISTPCGNLFLIVGWRTTTRRERKKNPDFGQWYKNGEPWDFPYVKEKVVAHGNTVKELIKSAKQYQELLSQEATDV